MLDIRTLYPTAYSSEEYDALQSLVPNFKNYAYYLAKFDKISLLPMLLLDPTKDIIITSRNQYTLTANEAERYINTWIDYNEDERYRIRCIYLKKGQTFLYNHCVKENYTYLDRISLYLQQEAAHKIKVYRKNKHIVIISNMDSDKIEKTLFSALPLIFKDDFEWTEEAITYFKLALEDKTQEMLAIFKNIIAKSKVLENIKKIKLKENLEFTTSLIKQKSEKELQKINKDIENYERTLITLYSQQRQEMAKIAFFQPAEGLDDTVNYILNNPYIVDYFTKNNRFFVVAIEAPLEYVDVPALKKMLSNVSSYLYPNWSCYSIPASIRDNETEFIRFLKDILINGKYKVYTRSEIVFDFETNQAYPLRYSGNYGTSVHHNRPRHWAIDNRLANSKERCITPHMHIEYYDCWSGNKTNIAKALNKQDLIAALDIAIATTKDINVNDSAVFGRFLGQGLFNPREYDRGNVRDPFNEIGLAMPGNTFKTIYDPTLKCFRTFDDIFQTDYLMSKAIKVDTDENLEDIIL